MKHAAAKAAWLLVGFLVLVPTVSFLVVQAEVPQLENTPSPAPAGDGSGPATPANTSILVLADESALANFSSTVGEIPEDPGIYFLDTATGRVQGWREKQFRGYSDWKSDLAWHRAAISGDNRFVAIPHVDEGGLLVDRHSNAVYQWRSDVHLLTSGDGQLASGGGRLLALTAGEPNESRIEVVDLGSTSARTLSFVVPHSVDHGLLSPDGRLALLVGDAAQIIDLEQGSQMLLTLDAAVRTASAGHPDGRRAAGPSVRNTLDGDSFLVLATDRPTEGEVAAGWAHYSWTGELITADTVDLVGFPRVFHPSPRGDVLAWVSPGDPQLPGGTTTVKAVDTVTGNPILNLPAANTCHESTAGNRWLADSSGLVVRTESGFKLAMRDGEQRPLPAEQLIPSPESPRQFANGTSVVDTDGGTIVAAAPPEWVRPWFSPWGDTGSELRIATLMVGRGGECAGLDFREMPTPAIQGPAIPDMSVARSTLDSVWAASLPPIDVYIANPGNCSHQTNGDHSYDGSWGYARDLGGCTSSDWKFYIEAYGLAGSYITSWVYATEYSGALYQRSGGTCIGPIPGQYGITIQSIQQQGSEYRNIGFYRVLHMASVDSVGTYQDNGYVIGQPDNRTWLYWSSAGNCQGDSYLYSSANHVHWWKAPGPQFSGWWPSPATYILFNN